MKSIVASLLSLLLIASAWSVEAQSYNSFLRKSVDTASYPFQSRSSTPSHNQQEKISEDDTIRINTTLVTVPLSVMDRDGRYVSGMHQEDFRIYEDGVEQEIAYFAPVDKPFTVVLAIDTSASTFLRFEDIQNAAIAFIDQLRPEDRVIVVSFAKKVNKLTEATSDRNILREAVRHTRMNGGTRLYDAVDYIINKILKQTPGRKALVLFTDGVDTMSRQAKAGRTINDVEEMDVLIYPIQYDTYADLQRFIEAQKQRGTPVVIRGSSYKDFEQAHVYLSSLAKKTGGQLYRADGLENISQAFTIIAGQLGRQYSLGYYPRKREKAAQLRRITVRVLKPRLIVRARDSYVDAPDSGLPTIPK